MLPRAFRLTAAYDFNRVKRLGKGVKTLFFGLFYAPSKNPADLRFGVIVTNAVEKRAVYRNKVSRQVKRFFSENLTCFHPGFDVVVVIYKPGLLVTYEELSNTFNHALPKTPLV